MRRLRVLALENTGLGDNGVSSLCNTIHSVPALQKLFLRRNRLGGGSARALAIAIAGESADNARMVRQSASEAAQKRELEALKAKSDVLAAVGRDDKAAKGPRARAAAAAALEAENARLAAIAAAPKIQVPGGSDDRDGRRGSVGGFGYFLHFLRASNSDAWCPCVSFRFKSHRVGYGTAEGDGWGWSCASLWYCG